MALHELANTDESKCGARDMAINLIVGAMAMMGSTGVRCFMRELLESWLRFLIDVDS